MAVSLIAVGLVAVVLLVLLVGIVVIAITTKNPAARIVLGLLAVAMVALPLMFVTLLRVSSSSQQVATRAAPVVTSAPATIAAPVTPTVPSSQDVAVPPSPSGSIAGDAPPETGTHQWTELGTDVMDLSQVPHTDATIAPLVRQIRQAIEEAKLIPSESAGEPEDPAHVIVIADSGIDQSTVLASVSKGFPGSRCYFQNHNASLEEDAPELILRFEVREDGRSFAVWDPDEKIASGKVVCTASFGDKSTTVEMNFAAKPWVESFDRFITKYPQRQFFVGYSNFFLSSASEAANSAMADATNQVSNHYARQGIASVASMNLVDRFSQRISRPYGQVWREAVLVEVTPQQLAYARAARQSSVSVKHRAYWSNLITLLALGIFTVAICAGINALTQGYYRGRLWVGIVVGSVLVILALFMAA